MRVSMMKSILWVVTIVGLISLDANIAYAQQKILFLHLRMQDDTIKLVGSNVRSGISKQARDLETITGIEYEFRSSSGLLLWNGVLEDPSIRRYEFEDSMKSGQITTKEVRLKDVEFTLRVPFKKGMSHVEFYRRGFEKSSSGMHKNTRKLIGAIDKQPERGRQ